MDKGICKSVGIFSNTFWSIYNFRKALVKRLLAEGYEVYAIAGDGSYRQKVEDLGCRVVVINSFDAQSTAVMREAAIIRDVILTLKNLPCEYIYTFTIKPNLYTALTSSLTGKKVIVTVNGLGNVFASRNLMHNVALQMFKRAFRRAHQVVFQNNEDYAFFRDRIGLTLEKVSFVRGSGVNTVEFPFGQKPPVDGSSLIFLMACRLLREKGVLQFVEAARRIRQVYANTQFWLLGIEVGNKSAVSKVELQRYADEGLIELLPQTDDVNTLLDRTDVLVLPSFYNEGVPRILLEGLSKGLPIITTDSVGCRETVEDGLNGYLIKPRSVSELETAIRNMISLPIEAREAMRQHSRSMAESQFDETLVVDAYVRLLRNEQPAPVSNVRLQPVTTR